MGMASAQTGGVVAVIKSTTKPDGSLEIRVFASLGRIGLSFETAVMKGAPPMREET